MWVWFSQVREEPPRREWWTHLGRSGDAEKRAGPDGSLPWVWGAGGHCTESRPAAQGQQPVQMWEAG